MGFNCGIVGLPNVGKSTLFNALTSTVAAEVANYPFCTIEPNIGRVAVPDERLDVIASIAKSAGIVPTFLEIVDIAGLIRGASTGEGLGNQFLARIREVDALIHMLRCFDSEDTVHVDGSVDPVRDLETVETELILADIQRIDRRLPALEKLEKSGDSDARKELEAVRRIFAALNEGTPARRLDHTPEEQPIVDQMKLLTTKPILYVCNVDEEHAKSGNAFSNLIVERAAADGSGALVVSAAVEAEIAQFGSPDERSEFLNSLGLEEPGLAHVVRAGYGLLELVTFFTAGPKEARAWTVERSARAPQAAGRIHTDFERGFICAETIAYDDFIACEGELGAKDAGTMHQEGRDYTVQDGDIILFKFNV
jgi:GTP-binding protein YchF